MNKMSLTEKQMETLFDKIKNKIVLYHDKDKWLSNLKQSIEACLKTYLLLSKINLEHQEKPIYVLSSEHLDNLTQKINKKISSFERKNLDSMDKFQSIRDVIKNYLEKNCKAN